MLILKSSYITNFKSQILTYHVKCRKNIENVNSNIFKTENKNVLCVVVKNQDL